MPSSLHSHLAVAPRRLDAAVVAARPVARAADGGPVSRPAASRTARTRRAALLRRLLHRPVPRTVSGRRPLRPA